MSREITLWLTCDKDNNPEVSIYQTKPVYNKKEHYYEPADETEFELTCTPEQFQKHHGWAPWPGQCYELRCVIVGEKGEK